MCQGNGEVTAAHPFCVILQKDRLYFKGTDRGTDRAVFLDKREFTGPIYTQIKEAVDFVLRNIRLGATIDGLVRKEKYEPGSNKGNFVFSLYSIVCGGNGIKK